MRSHFLRLGRDADGLKPRIVLLGTGTAFHSDGRGSQAILLEDASIGSLLVDIGPTAMCAMTRYGVDYERIDRLFVTHLHGDHVAGWPFFVLNLALEKRRTRPFDVWGPVGVRDSLEGLVGLCYGEIVSEAKRSFEVRYHELALEERSGIDAGRGLALDVLPMRHHPTSIAYRFLWDARSVAVTGDTGWCENLERLARGSRWLLAECTWREEGPGPHLSLAELRRGRERLGDCEILLVHLTDEVAAALAAQPIRGVSATRDGLELPLGR